jgi:Holliday junction resolvase RusA-like endonuclease
VITVTVHGLPAPQGSKRHVGNGRMVESSSAVGPWREAVRAQTQAVMGAQPTLDGPAPLTGPVKVAVTLLLPRPKSHTGTRGLLPSAPRYPATRPDLDKLVRAVLDGLVMGGALRDDAQVVELTAAKRYASSWMTPGMSADIREVTSQ